MEASDLTRLSPEIRNTIYEYVFVSQYAITLQSHGIQHPLTTTCRQLRDETLGMFLSLTSFNAHLDDGPVTPVARWLRAIGPDRCLLLHELNIWDLHMLNAILHGTETTHRMLKEGTEEGETYVLRPVGRQVFHSSWYLKDIILPLQAIGIGLERFCIVQEGKDVKQTSHFALTRLGHFNGLDNSIALAEEFGLSEKEYDSLIIQLSEGRKDIRLLDGRRIITMTFDEAYKVTSMRQEFIPRDEEFYI